MIDKIKGLFGKKGKPVDITKRVTNPGLKHAFLSFQKIKSEVTLNQLISAIRSAEFLVLIYRDSIITTTNENGNVTFEKGSKIKFLDTHDQNGIRFLPV